jgi:anti-sigma factor RsiW
MTCHDVLALIDPYLDDELGMLEMLRVDEHLAQCEACRRVRDAETDLHALLAADAVRDAPTARLCEHIARTTATSAAPRGLRSGRRVRAVRAALVSAVGVALVLGVLFVVGSRGPAGPLTRDAMVWHLHAEQTMADLELTTSDLSLITAWLGRRLGLRATFPAATQGGERVVGARVSSIASQQAAQLLYDGAGGRISLFITLRPFRPRDRGTEHFVEGEEVYLTMLEDVRVAWWSEGQHLYVVAGRASEAELLDFAALCIRLARKSDNSTGNSTLGDGRGVTPSLVVTTPGNIPRASRRPG